MLASGLLHTVYTHDVAGGGDAVLFTGHPVWVAGDLLRGGAAYGGGHYLLYVLLEEVSGD